MHISTLAVRRPVGTIMLTLAAMLLGAVSLSRLDVELLPELRTESVTVWIAYPDAAVSEVEEAVARPAEEAIAPVRGVRGMRSEVVPGGVSIRVQLHPGLDPELTALTIRERLDALSWSLPEGVERARVSAGGSDKATMVLALGAADLAAASDWASSVLRPRLEQVKGVARAEILGAPRREVRIAPDPVRMRLAGVTAAEMESALSAANGAAAGGVLTRRGTRYAVAIETGLNGASDVGDVVVRRNGDRPVHVRDLAKVEETWAPRDGFSRLDGSPAVGIAIHPESDANLVQTARKVRALLAELHREQPEFQASIVEDPSPFVERAIGGVWQSAWIGGLLAFIVLRLFLREWRSATLLLTALPVSVIASFTLFEIAGVSLNLMSLGGIALGIGMLVDSGILCLENIHRLRTLGLPPARAAAEGAREISLPMLASILTTCAVFVPLAWVPGPLGALFRDQAVAVSASLGSSLLTALTLLPMLASRWDGPVSMRVPMPLYRPYHRGLRACVRRSGLTLLATAVLLGASVLVLWERPRELLPEVSAGTLTVDLALPLGTDVDVTGAAAGELEAWLRERPEV
ncbi:MAG: efflux RND transporter permease subunit, partial [Candidatus Eisenbacteria bacterium]|nr:efflux RND transporter permease subunit [Candidatus Eisenbacteria bacterium]